MFGRVQLCGECRTAIEAWWDALQEAVPPEIKQIVLAFRHQMLRGHLVGNHDFMSAAEALEQELPDIDTDPCADAVALPPAMTVAKE